MTTTNFQTINTSLPSASSSEMQAASIKSSTSIDNQETTKLTTITRSNNLSWITDLVNSMLPPPSPISISVTKNEGNKIKLETADGYKINFAGQNEQWTIVAPNGTSTKIWGDPHVLESDKTKWDFTKQSSFIFGKNKITVETIPAEWNKKFTYSHKVTLLNGNDRITITDINKNEPKIEYLRFDAKSKDAKQQDGDIYKLQLTGEKTFSWIKQR